MHKIKIPTADTTFLGFSLLSRPTLPAIIASSHTPLPSPPPLPQVDSLHPPCPSSCTHTPPGPAQPPHTSTDQAGCGLLLPAQTEIWRCPLQATQSSGRGGSASGNLPHPSPSSDPASGDHPARARHLRDPRMCERSDHLQLCCLLPRPPHPPSPPLPPPRR
jgi:hypothetical protein